MFRILKKSKKSKNVSVW